MHNLFDDDLSIWSSLGLLTREVNASSILVELFPETRDLIMELTDHGVLGVLVDPRLILNVLGPARISQRTHRLICVVVRVTTIGNHASLGVSSQRILQDTGQLRISVRDVGALGIGQATDHMAQGRQGQVNLGRLLEPVTGCASLALSLTTRQIDDVKLSYLDMGFAILALFLLFLLFPLFLLSLLF